MEDGNSLDPTDSAEDRVYVPLAFTRDHAEWLTADDQGNFVRGAGWRDAVPEGCLCGNGCTFCSPFGLDSTCPTLVLSDVRAQPSKKDDRCAALETEGDLPDTTAII